MSYGIDTSIVYVRNDSDTRLALTHCSETAPGTSEFHAGVDEENTHERPVVLLAHGTFSNHRSCRGLSRFLTNSGFDCWILDFQGHGHSDNPARTPTFESMCLEDTKAALSYLRKQYPGQRIHWVGHSGGGLAILMYLARNPIEQECIGRVVTLASQATHAAFSQKNRFAIRAAGFITRLVGFAPGRWFGIGPEQEFASVMLQWYQWSLQKHWVGSDGFDYESALSGMTRPLLSLAAQSDTFIAPQEGCRHVFSLYGSTLKEFLVCGQDTGFSENYTHARLISSSNAAKEIWPRIGRWLAVDNRME